MKSPNFFILLFQLFNDLIAVPVHLETEFQLSCHLMEHVFERRVNALKHLTDIVVGAEHRAKAHGDDGVVLHHRLDDVLVSQGILARGIEDRDRSLAYDGGNVEIIDGVDQLTSSADADFAEIHMFFGLNDAVNIPATFSGTGGRHLRSIGDPHVKIFPSAGAVARGASSLFGRHMCFSEVAQIELGRDREQKPENRSLSLRATNLNSAVMILDDSFHNPQAEARASFALGTDKGLEHGGT